MYFSFVLGLLIKPSDTTVCGVETSCSMLWCSCSLLCSFELIVASSVIVEGTVACEYQFQSNLRSVEAYWYWHSLFSATLKVLLPLFRYCFVWTFT